MNYPTPPDNGPVDWFYFDGTQVVGPFPWATLQQLRRSGLIDDATKVRSSSKEDWCSLGSLESDAASMPPPVPPREVLSSEPEHPTTPAIEPTEFPVQFGTRFIPSSGGFRGKGVLVISPTDVEVRGPFALPVVVECVAAFVVAFIYFLGPGPQPVRLVGCLLIVGAYSLIKNRRRVPATQIAELRRSGNNIKIQFRRETRLQTITLRAPEEAIAQAIEQLWQRTAIGR